MALVRFERVDEAHARIIQDQSKLSRELGSGNKFRRLEGQLRRELIGSSGERLIVDCKLLVLGKPVPLISVRRRGN